MRGINILKLGELVNNPEFSCPKHIDYLDKIEWYQPTNFKNFDDYGLLLFYGGGQRYSLACRDYSQSQFHIYIWNDNGRVVGLNSGTANINRWLVGNINKNILKESV